MILSYKRLSYKRYPVQIFLPLELDAAAAISTGGKERVKAGDALEPPPPPPFVEGPATAAAAAPLVELAVKQLTLRPRDGRRRLDRGYHR